MFTPGPWEIDTRTGISIWGNPGRVCRVPIGDAKTPAKLREADANARLIAAAPDLLAALKELTEIDAEELLDSTSEPWRRVFAAIAKAEPQ